MRAVSGRIANFRLPVAAALALVSGIAAAYFLFRFGLSFFYLIAVVPVAAVIFIVLLFLGNVRRRAAALVLLSVFFAAGAAYASAVIAFYASPPMLSGEFAHIKGAVEEVRRTSAGRIYLVLSSVTADGSPLDGRIIAYLGEEAGGRVEAGYSVSVFGRVGHYPLISYGSIDYRVLDGVRYYVDCSGAMDYTYGFSLFGRVNGAIYDVLFSNLDYETAAVAYAMITGSTRDISEQTLNAFRYGGVAHIFAVSGLNITVFYVSVTAILKKLRMRRWMVSAVALAVVFFYTGMCGFAMSAVRAAIMCAVASLSSLAYKKYDALNSLAVSVVVILLVNPLNLFDVGFILSVCAMLGILFLSPALGRLLGRLPSGIRSNISLTLASQFTTLPALLICFGYISGAGLVLNIVILPVLSLLYVALFSCVVVCIVVPPLAPALLLTVSLPLRAVINFLVYFGFEDSLVSGFGGWWLAAVMFAAAAALSDRFNFAPALRAAAAGICALCVLLLYVFTSSVPVGGVRIVAGGYYGGGMIAVRTHSCSTLIVIGGTGAAGLDSFINSYMPGGADNMIIIGGDECIAYYYECGVETGRLYLPPSFVNVGGMDGTEVFYLSEFELDGIYYSFNDSFTLSVEAGGATFAVCAGDEKYNFCSDMLFYLNEGAGCSAPVTVCLGEGGGHFNVMAQGCLQFEAKDGKLIPVGIIPAK